MNEQEQFELDAKHFDTIIEALLFTADVAFEINTGEKDTTKYLEVIEALMEDNPEFSKLLQLKNINLFNDKLEEETAFVSNIKQLLGDKIIVKEL